jgi:hypothetical protein
MEIIWQWDHPAEEFSRYSSMDDDKDHVAEFRKRFAKFCTDLGILTDDGAAPALVGKTVGGMYLELPLASRARKRILELNLALDPGSAPRRVVLDLLVLETTEKLARRWGLDGLPASGHPPKPFADGIPSILSDEQFAALRAVILAQHGSRVYATASMTDAAGKCGEAVHVHEVPVVSFTQPDKTH